MGNKDCGKKAECSEGEEYKEMTPLLNKTLLRHSKSVLSKYHKFVFITSKPAIIILICNFVINLPYGLLMIPDSFFQEFNNFIAIGISGFIAITLLFAPLAGFLADVKFGRYKTVQASVFIILIASTCLLICMIVLKVGSTKIYYVAFCILLGILGLLYLIGYIGYLANILQFAMDQLRDAPSQDSVLFLHWHFWCFYVSIALTLGLLSIPGHLIKNIGFNVFIIDTLSVSLLGAVLLLVIIILIVSLFLTCWKRRWFSIEPSGVNPYKLVYRIVKFAWHHKIPVCRSAFTYCEDEWPSRLDLGKQKYGGPFTVEQVEDVKAYLGILKVLFLISPLCLLDLMNESAVSKHKLKHSDITSNNIEMKAKYILLFNGVLPSILILVCLPVYLCVLRPFISYWIPRTLKRIGIASALLCISFLLYFIISMTEFKNEMGATTIGVDYYCRRHEITSFNETHLSLFSPLNTGHLVVQCILTALIRMLLYISIWEFICSQSPHSMKGMLFGMFYAIHGLFRFLAVIFLSLFQFPWKLSPLTCTSGFYLVNLLIACISFVVYVLVARRYKYRVRDEPSREYQYAEEYYSR